MTLTLAGVAGPAVAALLFARGGPAAAFLLGGASFWASFASIALAARGGDGGSANRHGSPSTRMRDGLRTVAGDRGLMTVLVSSVVAAFAAGAVASVLVLLYLDGLHGPPAYGLFVSAAAAGSLVGAIAGAAVVSRTGPVATYVASAGLAGIVRCGLVMVHSAVAGGVVQVAYGFS